MIENNSSGILAKNRLKNIISSDRTNKLLNSKTMDLIKYDIYKSVSKYIAVDENSIKISLDDYRNENSEHGIIINASIKIDSR